MKSEAERGPWGAWMRDQRLQRGLSAEQVRERLAKRGYRVGESSYAEWESGNRKPSKEAQTQLVALYGGSGPDLTPEPVQDESAAAVLKAIERQTEMLERQWEVSTALVGNLTALVEEMRLARAESSGRDTALVEILARLEDAVAPESTPDVDESQPAARPRRR